MVFQKFSEKALKYLVYHVKYHRSGILQLNFQITPNFDDIKCGMSPSGPGVSPGRLHRVSCFERSLLEPNSAQTVAGTGGCHGGQTKSPKIL